MKSILLLDNIATLIHFLFTQTKQQYMVKAAFLLMADLWPCEMYTS